MSPVSRKPLQKIGAEFIPERYIPKGLDEYHIRNTQQFTNPKYRNLTAREIERLVKNGNTADNWNNIHVTQAFDPHLVIDCHFHGMVRIGNLEASCLEYHDLRMPVGLYSSTIIACDIGNNVSIKNARYLSHYIIGEETILFNIDEIQTSNHAKFGNGFVKEGENEQVRVWVELWNEMGGRKILPFDGILPADAWIWAKYRDDKALMQKLVKITENRFDKRRGYYGTIGSHTVIKHTRIIKDTAIGQNAYIKGANKLKNLTINSTPDEPTQIGEGVELVNGIIGNGCHVFYGVKAVRFIMGSHSSLKYGARLINSYLGDNSTISCCEVLNNLIYPNHEQHHNNSFLIASCIQGQSNIAASATIGSNHNSRANDGEIMAKRGFWPGLCTSFKHNSQFASFTLIAKGSYPAELNIQTPFSLVTNNEAENALDVIPAYWFLYNMYALERNSWKWQKRDKRLHKKQNIEYHYLAPDTTQEILHALQILEEATQKAAPGQNPKALLQEENLPTQKREILAQGFEKGKRKVRLLKVHQAWQTYRQILHYYAIETTLQYLASHAIQTPRHSLQLLPKTAHTQWTNLGGQIIPAHHVQQIKNKIKNGKLNTWEAIHKQYSHHAQKYPALKTRHALHLLQFLHPGKDLQTLLSPPSWNSLLQEAARIRHTLQERLILSRKKDYQNPYKKNAYDSPREQNAVIGTLQKNPFIQQYKEQTREFLKTIERYTT